MTGRDWTTRHWGKTTEGVPGGYHPAGYHQLDSAAVAKVLVGRMPLVVRRIEAQVPGLADWLPFLVGIHDLGKYSDAFQRQAEDVVRKLFPERLDRPAKRCTRRHTDVGYLLWRACLSRPGGPLTRIGLGERRGHDFVMAAVTGHHGMPPVDLSLAGPDEAPLSDACYDEDVEAAVHHVEDLLALLAPGARFPEADDKSFKRASWLLSGLTVLCDWIASNQVWFPHGGNDGLAPEDYWSVALGRAEAAVEASGILPQPVAPRLGFDELCPHLAGAEPSPLQRSALDLDLGPGPWFVAVEDMPGSGKTEAALAIVNAVMAGGEADGMYVGLPTMATANGMFDRMVEAYLRLYRKGATPSVVLAHGRAAFSDRFRQVVAAAGAERHGDAEGGSGEVSGTAQCSRWLADSRKRALLASAGIGTFDQALLGVLPSAHQSLRLFGLARNVLVVDEVHACDAYMLGLLKAVVRFLGMLGGSVVVLSATLTMAQRRDLLNAFVEGVRGKGASVELTENSYPLITGWSPAGLREVPVAKGATKRFAVRRVGTERGAVRELARLSREGHCACWVRNTVGDAVRAYDELVALLGADRVMLFHARFAPSDRDRIEEEVLSRFGKPGRARSEHLRPGTVLVATQVVEQSLDLDFDVMFSDLAPVDLLVQRAGRLQRHDRGARIAPVLWIVAPAPEDEVDGDWFSRAFPAASFVYRNDQQLWLGLRLLLEKETVVLPDDARGLIEGVFGAVPWMEPPASLTARALAAEGQKLGAAHRAGVSALRPDRGYACEGPWLDDQIAPTRLGDPTVTVRLLRSVDGAVLPWGDGTGMRALADGDVSLRRARIDGMHPMAEERVAPLRERWPDRGRWCVPVVMEPNGDGSWSGPARLGSRTVVVVAHPVRGISIINAAG